MTLSDNQKRNLDNKYDPVNLFPETYNYDVWFENEEQADTTRKSDKEESADTTRISDKEESVDLSDMPAIEGDEEVKEGKGLNMFTPSEL